MSENNLYTEYITFFKLSIYQSRKENFSMSLSESRKDKLKIFTNSQDCI